MAERIRKTVPPRGPAQRAGERGRLKEMGEALNTHVEILLNDIDDVLELNAEEFVRKYIQYGGE